MPVFVTGSSLSLAVVCGLVLATRSLGTETHVAIASHALAACQLRSITRRSVLSEVLALFSEVRSLVRSEEIVAMYLLFVPSASIMEVDKKVFTAVILSIK